MKDQHQQRINLVNCELCSHWNGMGNCIKKLITAHANNFYITWLQEIAKATQSIISTMMASPTILSSCCLSSTYTFKVSPTENLVLSDSLVVFHWVPSRAEWPLVDEDASHHQWFQVLFPLLLCSTSDVSWPFLWTVSGGEQYSIYIPMILRKWQLFDMYPTLVFALYIRHLHCQFDLVGRLCKQQEWAWCWTLCHSVESTKGIIFKSVGCQVWNTSCDGGCWDTLLLFRTRYFCHRLPIPIFLQEIPFIPVMIRFYMFNPTKNDWRWSQTIWFNTLIHRIGR